ncbi:MAG: HAD family phosphatase [Tissierellia bacterium]|nr:HAD family phosphatase [Tissierellia bacterium]
MKLAIFDMDGTIIDSIPFWNNIVVDYLKRFDKVPNRELKERLRDLTLKDGIIYMIDYYKLNTTVEQVLYELNLMLDKMYREGFELKEGTKELFEELKNRNIKLCLATATATVHVDTMLDRFGFRETFDKVLTSDNQDLHKNDPKYFKNLLEEFNISPEDAVLFEDSSYSMKTAKECGLKVVALTKDTDRRTLDEVEKYADLKVSQIKDLDIEKLLEL